MIISGFSKLTLLDYPGTVSCEIFTQGCNLRCPFCQNSSLISMNRSFENNDEIEEEEVLAFLEKRKKVLDGIVITGGEPTMQKDLVSFIKKVKAIGYKVKLDTNGFRPNVLKELLDNNLVDYVAMDIKNSFEKYDMACGMKNLVIDNVKKSIELLKNSHIDHEFRTTIVKEYHTKEDILKILDVIGNSKYYLQNFELSDDVIDKSLHGFSDYELLEMENVLNLKYNNIEVRGIRYTKEGGKVYV